MDRFDNERYRPVYAEPVDKDEPVDIDLRSICQWIIRAALWSDKNVVTVSCLTHDNEDLTVRYFIRLGGYRPFLHKYKSNKEGRWLWPRSLINTWYDLYVEVNQNANDELSKDAIYCLCSDKCPNPIDTKIKLTLDQISSIPWIDYKEESYLAPRYLLTKLSVIWKKQQRLLIKHKYLEN